MPQGEAGSSLLEVHLKEYEKLEDEQISRIGFRDNLICVTIAAYLVPVDDVALELQLLAAGETVLVLLLSSQILRYAPVGRRKSER